MVSVSPEVVQPDGTKKATGPNGLLTFKSALMREQSDAGKPNTSPEGVPGGKGLFSVPGLRIHYKAWVCHGMALSLNLPRRVVYY